MQNDADMSGIADNSYLVSLEPNEADLPLEDALFLERLRIFYEQGLTEIRAFAQREGRPYEEVSDAVFSTT